MKFLSSLRWRGLLNTITIPPPPPKIQKFSTRSSSTVKKKKKKKEMDPPNEATVPNRYCTYLTPEQRREFSLLNQRRSQRRFERLQPPKEDSVYIDDDDDDDCGIRLLSGRQKSVVEAVARGDSVFLTGSAGTGKSFLLSHIIRTLKKIHGPEKVFVTASTGVAACALEGQTLHSFAGVGLGIGTSQELLERAESNTHVRRRWKRAKALVIDEVSMIDGEFFDCLEFIARNLRSKKNKSELWGGIQIVVAGDFFQLPPIQPRNPNKEFAFEADCWNLSFDVHFELTEVFRQPDPLFVEVLQRIRRGIREPEHVDLLKSCIKQAELSEWDSSTTQLFPRSADVDRVNEEQLKRLGGEIISYRAKDSGMQPWKSQLEQGIAPNQLDICVGARVMLIKNAAVGEGLVNGATGTVVGFSKDYNMRHSTSENSLADICFEQMFPLVRFDSVGPEIMVKPCYWDLVMGEIVTARRYQVPLILAWALSVHKCQGMTLDSLRTDLSGAFGYGMVYVALSRVKHLAGLQLTGLNPKKIVAHPKVLQFDESLRKNHSNKWLASQLLSG